MLSRRTILGFSLAPILLASDNSDWILKLAVRSSATRSGT